MKVSRTWLQNFFADPLPSAEVIADALTFHSSEVEEIQGDMLDIKILPDRASYGLCHRGIAYEIAAITGQKLSQDPLAEIPAVLPETDRLHVSIENPEKCLRYQGALMEGVTVGPSPVWLVEALASVGQRSINNVVDATNYVMLTIGQPLHAFDADLFVKNEQGAHSITVRGARAGEKIITLTGEEYTLPENTTLIVDAVANTPIGIAGVKGGKAAQITETTKNIIIESANFDATSTRRTAQAIKLTTDASLRYQNKLSPELTAYGMRDVIALIIDLAGGTLVGGTDVYPSQRVAKKAVNSTRSFINGVLGSDFTTEEMLGVLDALLLSHTENGEEIIVTPPFYRNDIVIGEDLAEEIGRVLGYDRITGIPLPAFTKEFSQDKYKGIERIKDLLIEQGFTEISTQAFSEVGESRVLKPLQLDRASLRPNLSVGMREALVRAAAVAPRILGPEKTLTLFEIGSAFGKDSEQLVLALGYQALGGKSSDAVLLQMQTILADVASPLGIDFPQAMGVVSDEVLEFTLSDELLTTFGKGYAPKQVLLGVFRPFSAYPFALRDIAVWTPEVGANGFPTEQSFVEGIIIAAAGDLLVRIDLFDRFQKESRVSYAFRLVFQSNERTLSDADLDPIMAAITSALTVQDGFDVR
jgi:phenylalanyl-tRNA synthetase beta chain